MDKEKILKAGKIAKEVREWIKPQIKKNDNLLDIAEKIENKIEELGGKPAFPTNLSINEQAAHYTPSYEDQSKAHGLIKIDFGVHIDGWIADQAFSLDLENSIENKKLIEASENALEKIRKKLSSEITLGEIGKTINQSIKEKGFNPVANLSGHSMEKFELHAGLTIPNINNSSSKKIGTKLIAIEPFVTNGKGLIHEGNKGNIYLLIANKKPRSPFARETLEMIQTYFPKLPFASRWIIKKIGSKAILGIKQLENEGIIHQYAILTEEKGKLISQSEHTFLVQTDDILVTTD